MKGKGASASGLLAQFTASNDAQAGTFQAEWREPRLCNPMASGWPE